MKTPPKPNPTFSRPLLDFTKTLRHHQCSLTDHMPAFEILDKTAKELEAIQISYELMPSSDGGKWFLLSTYESARRNIPERCARLKAQIDRIRPTLEQEHQHSETEALDKALEDLVRFLDEAAYDPSHLSKLVKMPAPEGASEQAPPASGDISPTIEA